MTAYELADFEPSTGHLHACLWGRVDRSSPWTMTNLQPCDCAAHLYCIAQDAGMALREANGDVDYCLSARLDGPDHQPYLCQRPKGHQGASPTRRKTGVTNGERRAS